MIAVVGGVYEERCLRPHWDQVIGSGGRAAIYLSGLGIPTTLHTYVLDSLRARIAESAEVHGFTLVATTAPQSVSFLYAHCFSQPRITPDRSIISPQAPLIIEADTIIRFGMMEGDAVVRAKTAVYDPQATLGARHFRANGSTAERLAVIANRREIAQLSGSSDVVAGARQVLQQDRANVVVVKCGLSGALVVTASSQRQVPAYRSDLVWTLGSGDLFVAAFAHAWALERLDPVDAADVASRCVSLYSNTQSIPTETIQDLRRETLTPATFRSGTVYLAGPFFTLAERWLIEEARRALLDFGMEVFSPIHDVGSGPGHIVAPLDLAGLDRCDRVLALLPGCDPGTLYEVGYARHKELPVIGYAETVSDEDLKMLVGTGCTVSRDFATALAHTCWQKLP